ncbi:G2-specific protein kinase nim-1 [Diaporthe helianthi]|uniref:mitogen-activated protein kinase n=1 Tax=Diaporthe helianthi TaxID=158607 RepID=A0A2P5HF82_DIAHE|nr:G2-specific protein kinase nim-1 [Diaporthe helianthi]
MFYDDSSSGTSSALGPDSLPFRLVTSVGLLCNEASTLSLELKRVLIFKIAVGGVNCDLITFKLDWRAPPPGTLKMVQQREVTRLPQNPRLERTGPDDRETPLPTMPPTQTHFRLPKRPMIRWAKVDNIGSGAFGRVDRAVDVDSGRLIAVKTIRIRENQDKETFFRYLNREIEAMGRIEHDCVASMDMVHRDVKPDNILYTHGPNGEIIFKLADFGLCNHSAFAQSQAGTPLYMAPEVCSGKSQSPKADMWSLLVVMLWIHDFKRFRTAHFKTFTVQQQQQLAQDATSPGQQLEFLKEMARVQPEKRASAAQMMRKLGLFDKNPRAILITYGGNPYMIPDMPRDDDLLPVPPRPQQPRGWSPGYPAKVGPSASDVEMTGMTRTYLGRAPRR